MKYLFIQIVLGVAGGAVLTEFLVWLECGGSFARWLETWQRRH